MKSNQKPMFIDKISVDDERDNFRFQLGKKLSKFKFYQWVNNYYGYGCEKLGCKF